jgi:DNA polymerase III delta prime subunit
MRFVLVLTIAALVAVPEAFAGNPDKILDPQEITALAAKAEQATPKDRCYLYAELVSAMTAKASQQLNAGDNTAADATLKTIREYTSRIHADITNNSKKLKDAQIMMRYTVFRLKDLMKSASLDDQPAFETTLKQLDQVQSQMMLAVFQK